MSKRRKKRKFFSKMTKSSTWNNHKDTLHFIFIFVGVLSFLPVWITLFIMFLLGNWSNVEDLWNGGGFFIYSASLSGSSIYMLDKYPKNIFHTLSWIILIFSATGFTIPTLSAILSLTNKFPDPSITAKTSVVFALIALVINYYSHYYSTRTPDPDRESRKNIKNIMDGIS